METRLELAFSLHIYIILFMLKINAEARNVFRKGLKGPRKEGKLPVVVYGEGKNTEHYFVNEKDFLKLWKEAGETSVISFDFGKEKKDVLIQDVAFDPVKGNPLHVDFFAVEQNKLIEVTIPLEFMGNSLAVKGGGTLVKVIHEVVVEAFPRDIPHQIEVDISVLETFEDQILVKDLKLPAGVKMLAEAEEVVALVSEAVGEEEESTEPVDISKIEVEKKGKKEEEAPIE